ncbi:hypothetical protein PDN62_07155 [Bacillus cereus]|nr:hypothetical protein [Bacillus cereus]
MITVFVNHLFFLGKSKEENMTENRKKLLLQNENKQSILTLVNLRAEVRSHYLKG